MDYNNAVVKQLLVIITICFLNQTHSQIDIIAPSPTDSLTTTFNFHEITSELDSYWSIHQSEQQGSGLKPYLRWKEMWKYSVKPNGRLITPNEIERSWKNLKRR